MKKIFIITVSMVLLFCGCSSKEVEEERFSLSKGRQELYKGKIEEILQEFYWEYDEKTLAYYETQIPTEDENGIFEASDDSGYNLKRYKGREAVAYTADMYHFNDEKAGIVYFYFVNNNVVSAYYTPADSNGKSYGLKSRNVFRNNATFTAFEDKSINEREFSENKTWLNLEEGFCDIYKYENDETYMLSVEGNRLKRYKLKGNYISVYNDLNILSATGYTPISATMLENGEIAVMVGSVVNESADFEGNAVILAEKIIFLNSNFQKTSQEIEFSEKTNTCIRRIEDGFVVINDRSINIYHQNEGVFERKESYNFGIQAYDFKECDIDGDKVNEYIVTDGKDLFVYRKKETGFECAWKTNISVDSFYGNIYIGDLNGDNVKEIYICDNTGTAIKYILTEKGFISDNEKIDYGNRIYAGDFDGNGKDDFIFIDNVEDGSITLNLAK